MTSVVLTTAAVPAMSFYERNGYGVIQEMAMMGRTVKTYEKKL